MKDHVDDNRLEKVLGNLLISSTRHYETHEKTIEEGIDNLTCREGRNRQNRNQNR
ncbi:MAG TPA: hypothetical protein GXZ43_03665 [Clostridiaceae bacterium]|nr:hypothetical protein [Clostridiaceae bacterium]